MQTSDYYVTISIMLGILTYINSDPLDNTIAVVKVLAFGQTWQQAAVRGSYPANTLVTANE